MKEENVTKMIAENLLKIATDVKSVDKEKMQELHETRENFKVVYKGYSIAQKNSKRKNPSRFGVVYGRVR